MAKAISTLSVPYCCFVYLFLFMAVATANAMERPTDVRRVLVIGSTGTGKSTLINALVGKDVLDTSSNAEGCTSKYTVVEHTRYGTKYEFIDTVGLNDASSIKVDHQAALRMFFEFLWNNSDGFNLIIFCMKEGRLTKESQKTYEIMVKQLYSRVEGSAPVLVVVGGNFNNHSEDPQKWCDQNRHVFVEGGITEAQKNIDGLHCISLPRDSNPKLKAIYENMRLENAKYAWKVIDRFVSPKPIQYFGDLKAFFDLCVSLWNSMMQSFQDWFGGDWQSSKVTMKDIKMMLEAMGYDILQMMTFSQQDLIDALHAEMF